MPQSRRRALPFHEIKAKGPAAGYLRHIRRQLKEFDELPAELRMLIDEYGWDRVAFLWNRGARDPQRIETALRTWREHDQWGNR